MVHSVIIIRHDGKRPDGLTLVPWQGNKPLTWDVKVVSTLADSYLHSTSHSAGSAAETASIRKESKYSAIIFPTGRNWDPWPPQRICSKLFKWGGPPADFFIWRFSRDFISVPAPLNAHTALQLCSDYGLLLLLWRRPGPLATSDVCF